jgi:hypothetical protein
MPRPLLRSPSHPQAIHAIRAAENLHRWGPHATRLFLRNRSTPLSLLYLAYGLSQESSK